MIKKLFQKAIERAQADKKIFCIANRFGVIFFLVFVLLLLVGGTYQNNLVFMMAFLLLALGLVTIIQTARNIRFLEVVSGETENNFENQKATVRLLIKNKSNKECYNIQIKVENFEKKSFFRTSFASTTLSTLPAQSLATVEIQLPLTQKWGRYQIQRVDLATEYPYGLFKSWTIHKCPLQVFIYPEPQGTQELPFEKSQIGEDYSGHRPFLSGDSYSRVDWKKWAQGKGLLTKEYNSAHSDQIIFEMNELKKHSVHQASQWILTCYENQIQFGLQTEKQFLPPAGHSLHFHQVLKTIVQESIEQPTAESHS